MKMEEQVKDLESQLKDSYKGQIGNSQEVLKLTKENKDLADRNRENERKINILYERLREYEDILKEKSDEYDIKEQQTSHMKSEYDGMKTTVQFLEE